MKMVELWGFESSGKAMVASDLEVELDTINAAALVTNFNIKEEAEQKKKMPEESRKAESSHKKESNFPLLRRWKEMEMHSLENERNEFITPHNQVISVDQFHSNEVEKDRWVPAVLNSDYLEKYEADKKSDMIQKTTKTVSDEIETQEQLRVAVHSKRDSVHSKLLISRLRAEDEKLDPKDIEYLNTLKPPDSHWHQNFGAEALLYFHNNSNMHAAIASGHAISLAITAGEDKVESELNEKSPDKTKKRDEIDEKFEKFDQSLQQNIDEAKKMTSGTRTELKRLDLVGKVAEQSQGSYQSEFMARLNEQVTPQNSSSNSEACYQKIVRSIDFTKLN